MPGMADSGDQRTPGTSPMVNERSTTPSEVVSAVKVSCMVVPFESASRGTPGDSYCGRAVVNARGSTHGFVVFTGLTSLVLVTTASLYVRPSLRCNGICDHGRPLTHVPRREGCPLLAQPFAGGCPSRPLAGQAVDPDRLVCKSLQPPPEVLVCSLTCRVQVLAHAHALASPTRSDYEEATRM